MRARLSDEGGFTLVELLAAMVVGMIVMFAIFGLLDTAVSLQAKSVDRVETTDRGRVGIDQISQGFASRICIGDEPSLVAASDTSVEFYASVAAENTAVRLPVQRRRLTVAGSAVREDVWMDSPPKGPPNLPPPAATTPTRTRTIVSGIGTVGTTPILRYYARDGVTAQPTVLLSTPLSAIDRRRATMIDVSFTAQGKRDDVSTVYANKILTRSATCV